MNTYYIVIRLVEGLMAAEVVAVAAGAGHTAVLCCAQTLAHLCQRALMPCIRAANAAAVWRMAQDHQVGQLGSVVCVN